MASRVTQRALRSIPMGLRITFYSLLVVLLAACAETPQVTREPVRLRVGDASDQAAVIDKLIDAYVHNHEWVTFTNDALSIKDAIDRVRNEHLDMAFLPSSPEQANAQLWTSGLAYDPLAIIVHPGNPANDLTLLQLRDIFQGRTFDWTPYGGTGEVIPVSREANALARTLFEQRVMNNRAVTLNAVLKPSAQDVIDFVARTPGAIGYVSLSHIDARVKVLSIEGVEPDQASAASGKYVLSAPIYLIAKAEPTGDAREFVAWLLGDEGQSLLSQLGFGRVR
jgi:ABC-type phosphate transport system substrate-binding protein